MIDPDVDPNGTSVAVESGPAAATRASDESGKFWIAVESSATSSDILALEIELSGGSRYWLSLPVNATTH